MKAAGKQRQLALTDAQRALQRGDWRCAARELEQAAEMARIEGDATRAAHCLQMAAALHRARGVGVDALAAASRASKVAGRDPRARFAASAELGEALIAQGEFERAAAAYRQALATAGAIGLPPWARATVLRRLAEADAGRGALAEAWHAYDAAAQEMVRVSDALAAAWIHVEHANRAREAGALEHARELVGRPGLLLLAGEEPHLASERLLLIARLALDNGRFAEAAECARLARARALEAVAPLSYYAAAVALAEAFEGMGRHTNAYAALATAWATLGDVLGRDVAESWVAPILEAYRMKWGGEGFATAKAQHDARRKAAIRSARGAR